MVLLIIGCVLALTLPSISVGGALVPAPPPPALAMTPPPAIILPAEGTGAPSSDPEADGDAPRNDAIRSNLREGIVKRSIQVLRGNGMSDEKIRAKMMDSFSLDAETVDRLLG